MNEKLAKEHMEFVPREIDDVKYGKWCWAKGYLEAIEKAKGLEEALERLHDDIAEYVRIDNLGPIDHNQSMIGKLSATKRMADKALSEWRKIK